MDARRWSLLVLSIAMAFAVLIQIPQWMASRDVAYHGVPIHLNSDEYVYLARVEEALTGRPEQSAEAITGNPTLKGSQPAFLERAVGTLFAWTGWRAATVLHVMDSMTIFLLVLALVWFFRLCGFSRKLALSGTVLFCAIQLYNLNRPIHQALSLLLLLSACNFLVAGVAGRRWMGVVGGVLLGLLFGDYFWSWSFGWLFAAVLLTGEFAASFRTGRSLPRLRSLLGFLLIGVVVASPFLLSLWSLWGDPLFAQATFRSGMRPGYLPESWVYSALFVVMTAGVWMALRRSSHMHDRHAVVLAFLLTAFLVIHQQLLHGQVFNFVSHYLLAMAVATVGVLLLAWSLKTRAAMLAGLVASLYLAAIAWDGRIVVGQFRPSAESFTEQHFADALPILDALPRATILSDPWTSMFLAGATYHDVIYSVYLKNVLMSHEDIARRYCVAVAALAPANRRLEGQILLWPDANGAFKDPTIRERELTIVREQCAAVDADPAAALRAFNIHFVFWDAKRQPAWDPRRLRVPLTKIAEGNGWELWQVSGSRVQKSGA